MSTLYPYKAFLDTILSAEKDEINTVLKCEGFEKDTAGFLDNVRINKQYF